MLVEDEVPLARLVERGLRKEGYVVEVEHNGTDGLWHATEESFDVIVLDIMLPGIHGYDVLRRLRERKIWTPVLMLTAKDGEFDQVDALDLGADDYLTKPFSFPVLVARLRALVRRTPVSRPVSLEAGGLRLDPASARVFRGDTEIDLTPREFNLLQFLMRRSDTTVAKSEILQHVWDPAFEGDDNVVEVYVGYLRRKVDRPFGTDTITTVRGVGYRLDAS
ncbi:DNA-binding response regulator [Flexivirga endophytica]|uniref:DNA-binding response regulator n=1 Tax=Flexivirga endophytica TaxID=1849103 RepID=A0A916T4M7_9MICO|nr:DNA-binding response regulator [Flexivirga endophytica]GHB52253.1 DNA-binding response regulator [Flexivirga endophytica]